MNIVILVIFLIPFIIFTIFLVKSYLHTSFIVNNFKNVNVIVVGKKGTGKDLLFNKVINKRKSFYYANIPYNDKYGYKIITPKDISIYPNTYEQFLENKLKKVKRIFYENKDIYLSDGGIVLPSYMDSRLYKTYPSLPCYYALSRHLYNSNLHVNVQNLGRVWKALREQADFYCVCKRTIKIPFFLITRVITYDKYQSVEQGLMPMKNSFLNKHQRAIYQEYKALYGDIRCGYVIQRKCKVKYDTRYFEKVLLKGKRKIYKHKIRVNKNTLQSKKD